VTNVVDQLSIVAEPQEAPTTGVGDPSAGALTSDAGITSQVKAKLLADTDVSGLRIDVDTSNRVVTLTGTVKTEAEKTEALQIARQVEGVTSVTDRLTVERRQ
jgi:hyperosmotically inducible protein